MRRSREKSAALLYKKNKTQTNNQLKYGRGWARTLGGGGIQRTGCGLLGGGIKVNLDRKREALEGTGKGE